ncbi:hypothetical protein MUP77_19500 [Candidatus Bathyarchaeota archaeon]|nr:hypothetical protein [Candidatus Bathyarchaeota archaeon]
MNKLALSLVGLTLMMILITPNAIACIESTSGKVTGGGQIPLDPEQTTLPGGSFGFNVMYYPDKMDAPKGELEYIDHVTGMNVHAHTMTGLEVFGPPNKSIVPWTANFEGYCKVDGEEGYFFWVHVEDWGEPGKLDNFHIIIWEVDSSGNVIWDTPIYGAEGWPILVGNIQVHKK